MCHSWPSPCFPGEGPSPTHCCCSLPCPCCPPEFLFLCSWLSELNRDFVPSCRKRPVWDQLHFNQLARSSSLRHVFLRWESSPTHWWCSDPDPSWIVEWMQIALNFVSTLNRSHIIISVLPRMSIFTDTLLLFRPLSMLYIQQLQGKWFQPVKIAKETCKTFQIFRM